MSGRNDLVKGLGIYGATSVVAGTMIGTAIFVVPGIMVQHVGSPWRVMFVWIFAGILTLFGALGYAELGAALPEAGGEYVYLHRAYGPLAGFLYGWTQFFVAKTGSIAAIATGFMIYLGFFFPRLNNVLYETHPAGLTLRLTGLQLGAAALILLLSALNVLGVRRSGTVQTIFTASKLGVLALLVVLGLGLGRGSFGHFQMAVHSRAETGMISAFGLATVSALWAYDGWNNLSMVAGEVEAPQRNMPRALILGSLLVIVVYALTNFAYFYLLSPAEVAGTGTVAADAARRILGAAGGAFVAVGVMVSSFATLNGSILAGSRIPFAQARDGLFPQALAGVHPRFHTPAVAIAAQAVVAGALALSGQYEALFTKVIFSEWLFYALVTVGVFVLRRRRPDLPRPYRTWGFPLVPGVFVILAGLLLTNTFFERRSDSLWGLVLMATGVPAYYLWKLWRRKKGPQPGW
ncbi:MAG: amino acid permease [Acidobacteriia bacterium]|nr:amino acid permease [Terriglobia bacterium]